MRVRAALSEMKRAMWPWASEFALGSSIFLPVNWGLYTNHLTGLMWGIYEAKFVILPAISHVEPCRQYTQEVCLPVAPISGETNTPSIMETCPLVNNWTFYTYSVLGAGVQWWACQQKQGSYSHKPLQDVSNSMPPIFNCSALCDNYDSTLVYFLTVRDKFLISLLYLNFLFLLSPDRHYWHPSSWDGYAP